MDPSGDNIALFGNLAASDVPNAKQSPFVDAVRQYLASTPSPQFDPRVALQNQTAFNPDEVRGRFPDALTLGQAAADYAKTFPGYMAQRLSDPANLTMFAPGDLGAFAGAMRPTNIGHSGAAPALAGTPLQRAQAMGFYTQMPVYHGTAREISAFDPARAGDTSGSLAARHGISVALEPDTANEFAAKAAAGGTGDQPNVLPLLHRASKPAVLRLTGDERDHEIAATLADAFAQGHDAVLMHNYTTPGGETGRSILFVRDPNQLRSLFAQFDPAKINSSDLLAGLGAGIAATGATALGTQQQQ